VGKRRSIAQKAQWSDIRHPWKKLTVEIEKQVVFVKLPRVDNLALTEMPSNSTIYKEDPKPETRG